MEYKPIDEKYYFNGKEYICPLDLAMEIIGGKWKVMLLFHLQFGPLRSGALKRRIKVIPNSRYKKQPYGVVVVFGM